MITTSIYEYLPESVGLGPEGAIDALKDRGWTIHYSWGRDGWDVGPLPYVFVATRDNEGLVYVEGDITIYDNKQELDKVVHWYWNNGTPGPKNPDLENPDHCGPFEWGRLEL